jgi:hypothetical protein
MSMKRLLQGFIITVALCLCATTGSAQDNKFFLTGGGSTMLDNRSINELFRPWESSWATGGKGTAGFEHPIKKSKVWSAELSYGFGENHMKLADYDYSYHPNHAYSLWADRVSADLVLHTSVFTYRGGHPYLVAGVEYDSFTPSSAAKQVAAQSGFGPEPSAGTQLKTAGNGGVNFGAGMEWKITSKIGFRLEARDHVFRSPTLGLPTSEPATAGLAWFPVSGNTQNIEYSVGLTYRFGK